MFVVLSTKSLCLKRVQPYSPMPHTSVAFCASLYIAGTRWTIFIWSLLTGSVMIRNVWGKDSFWRELCTALSSVLCPPPPHTMLSPWRFLSEHLWFSSFFPDCKCLWVRDLASSASLSIPSIPSKGVFTWYCSMSVRWRNQHMLPRWEGKESVKLKLVHQK